MKDGDCISNHKNCNVVKSQAFNKSFYYCRDCKIEVVESKNYIERGITRIDSDKLIYSRLDGVMIEQSIPLNHPFDIDDIQPGMKFICLSKDERRTEHHITIKRITADGFLVAENFKSGNVNMYELKRDFAEYFDWYQLPKGF